MRWQTLDYQNRPQFDTSVFNGKAGIPPFLDEYVAQSSNAQARGSAIGGAPWCKAQRTGGDHSLYFGRGGLATAWLCLAATTGDDGLVERAAAVAEPLLSKGPGPVTDLLGGAAGEIILLIRI